MDEILNSIDVREAAEADIDYINNPEVLHGAAPIPNLGILYTLAFKRLLKSAKTWRKKDGRKGYTDYIRQFLA